MRAWDSVTQGDLLRPGPAAFAILLAGLLLSLAPVSTRMEAAYYDFLQGLQEGTGSSQVVLIDTGRMSKRAGTLWETNAFPDLLRALDKAGARLVIPVEPPPLRMALPDSAQLAALAELERRSREASGDGAVAKGPPIPDTFGRQLAEMRHRSELHGRIVQAAAASRNLIVGVPTFDGNRGAEAPATSCLKQVFETSSPIGEDGIRKVRAVVPPSDTLCEAALGAGHVEFWPEADGVVRRMELLVNAAGSLVQSSALRATLAYNSPGAKAASVTRDSLTWDSHAIRTTGGTGILLRFYPARDGESAFETLDAEAIIGSSVPDSRISGHIAILGDTSLNVEPGYATSIADRASPASLLATGLSNLLESDYLVRTSWLTWLESAMLIVIGVVVLLWGRSLAPALTIMTGILIAVLLLATEAYLVVASGVWVQLATAAAFTVFSTAAIRFLQPRRTPAALEPALPALAPVGAGAPVSAQAAKTGEDELELAFSMLRHQSPNEHVKKRLYDIALEHARRRDLAKAERVLRHLASIDPGYRNAGEKLKKLAGLRSELPQQSPPESASRPATQAMPEPDSLSGQVIGRYQIEQPIGRGAMATVYLGRDPKINRRVAIKTIALAEEFGDTDLANARTQFLREAESAGRLNHPNIISIYDAGEDGQVAYLAMEYFPGKPLSFYAQQGNLLPPRRVFELMARAAEALHYAHGQHVVHRDVKPANLLYDAETDTLKITDFGIARLTDTSRTKTGIILGTPSYMSPEQLAGTSVTGQSDLFSLAVTLYQLLTGVPPFRADSIPMLMQKIAHERHEAVSSVRSDLPPCVDELLNQALAKDPADRYPSGRAMALALRDCCSSFAPPGRNRS